MKALLTRFALRRVLGLAIEPKRVALSVVVTTPLGHREVHRDVQDRDGRPLEAVLGPMLAPWVGAGRGKKAGRGPWVQVALPEAQVFQAAVPIGHANRNASPEAYFLEAVQSTNTRAEERIIDLLRIDLGKQALACLAAALRGPIAELVDQLQGLGVRVAGVGAAPAALARAGGSSLGAPRGSRLLVRFFLAQDQAIGVLAAGALPLFWHDFELPGGDATAAIRAAHTTLWMMARDARIPLPIDTVIVHGRPDLALKQDPEELRRRTGVRWLRGPEPAYDLAGAAFGAALASPLGEEEGHDLARGLKPPVFIRDIVPWGALAVDATLVAAASVFLGATASEAEARLRAVRAEQKSFAWLKQQPHHQLEAERKDLEERSRVIGEFQGRRVDWSAPLRAIAAAAPESTVITTLQGEAPLEVGKKSPGGKTGRKLLVNFATPLPDDGAMPREIDGFLAALRRDPALVRQFPLIEVSGLRANPARRGGGRPFASYSVVCLPRAESTRKAARARRAIRDRDHLGATTTMSEKSAKSNSKQLILGQLRHPLKLRLALFVSVLGGWYYLVFAPLSERLAATTSAVDAERKRIAVAREIAGQKKALTPHRGRVLATADLDVLMRCVIDHLRSSPVKLADLKPEKPQDLGPYESVGLRLTLEGPYAEIDRFLGWIESSPLLLRADSVKLDPSSRDPGRLTAQLVVLALAEKSADASKGRPTVGQH